MSFIEVSDLCFGYEAEGENEPVREVITISLFPSRKASLWRCSGTTARQVHHGQAF